MKKLCLIILIICVGSCFPAYADTRAGAPLEKVSIQLKWHHQFQFAGYYAAKEKGFYADEGLDVDIVPGGSGIDVAERVETGAADFGVLSSEGILERLNGRALVMLAVIFQRSQHTLMVDAQSNILTPADLVGKPIMLNIPQSAEFMTMFAREGISRQSLDITQKDKTAMDKLVAGEIAAMNGSIANQPFLFRQRGMPVRLIQANNYGVNFIGDSLFTSEQHLADHPEQVAAFRRATLRGWDYALSHDDETIDLILEKYAPGKALDHLKFEATITQALILLDLVELGSVNPIIINRIADTFTERQLAPVDHSGILAGFIYHPPSPISDQLSLTPDEKAWLKEHPVIRLGESTDHAPFMVKTETGELQGIIVDYYKIVASRLGIRFEFVNDDWGKLLQKAAKKEIDGVAYMARIAADQLGLHGTRSSMNVFATVFGLKETGPDINGLADLKGLRVAYFKDVVFLREYLNQHAEEIEIIEADNPLQAMQYVVEGRADVMLGLNFNSYLLSKYMLPGLTALHINNELIADTCTGIRSDWPELVPILNKAIDSISLEEVRSIMLKWGAITASHISLTEKEWIWLKEHPVIRVGADPVWAPLEFKDESGAFQGISVDYLERIQKMIGIKFEFIDKPTWDEVLEMAKNGELDILSSVKRTPSREQYLSFTDSYIEMPIVVFSGPELPFVGGLEELIGGRVAVVKGYATEELLTSDHPDITLVSTESTVDALHLLARNEVDVFVGNILTTSYYLGQLGYSQIKVAGDTPYIYNQTIGVRKDWPVLAGILQKALDAIPPQERNTIRQQWVAVKYEHGFDYTILWKVLAITFVVFSMFFYWNRMLKKQILARTSELASINKSLESEINERNLAENALKESEDLLNRTGDIAKVGGWQVDIEARKVIWTQTTGRIHELPDDYLPDLAEAINFYHPDDREMVREFVNRAIETGKSFEFDARLITAKGRQTWVRALGQSAFKAGKCVRLSGTFQDITERKETEDKLKQQLDELQRWHGLTSDRENRVMELKREVNGLLRRLGKPVRYSSQTDSHEEGNTTDAD